jgi:hypothetical protein
LDATKSTIVATGTVGATLSAFNGWSFADQRGAY